MDKNTKEKLFAKLSDADSKTSWKLASIPHMELSEGKMIKLIDPNILNANNPFELPYDESAVQSICDRAEVSGRGITRLPETLFNIHLNDYFNYAPSKSSIVNIYDNNVYACLSENYKILNIMDCVKRLIEHIDLSFDDVDILNYGISATYTYVDFEVRDTKVLKKYSKAFEIKMNKNSKTFPVLRFVTSNTGYSGANLYPLLKSGSHLYFMCEPIVLNHKGDATIAKFSKNCEKIYSLILEGADKMEELAKISIDNPAECAANIAKEIKLPKKVMIPILEDMKEIYGYSTCSARDVYQYLSKYIETVEGDWKQHKAADMVSRALSLDFKKFDRSYAQWLSNSKSTESVENNYYQSFFVA